MRPPLAAREPEHQVFDISILLYRRQGRKELWLVFGHSICRAFCLTHILTWESYQYADADSVSLERGLRWYSSKCSQMVLRLLVPGPCVARFLKFSCCFWEFSRPGCHQCVQQVMERSGQSWDLVHGGQSRENMPHCFGYCWAIKSHPKFSGIRQPRFPYDHQFCGWWLPVGNSGEGLSWLLDVQVLSWKTGMLRWESSDSFAHTIQRLAYSHICPLAEETGGPGLLTRGPEGRLSM